MNQSCQNCNHWKNAATSWAGNCRRMEREIEDRPAKNAEQKRIEIESARRTHQLISDLRDQVEQANHALCRARAEIEMLKSKLIETIPCVMCDNGDGHLRHICPRKEL